MFRHCRRLLCVYNNSSSNRPHLPHRSNNSQRKGDDAPASPFFSSPLSTTGTSGSTRPTQRSSAATGHLADRLNAYYDHKDKRSSKRRGPSHPPARPGAFPSHQVARGFAAAAATVRPQPQPQPQPRSKRHSWKLLEAVKDDELPVPFTSRHSPNPTASTSEMILATIEDDDVVLDTPAALLGTAAAAAELLRHTQAHKQAKKQPPPHPHQQETEAAVDAQLPEAAAYQHPASRGVSTDVIHLVTDAFKQQREAEVTRRRQLLYELTHPNPLHYTYGRKLVPPPPLSFGEVTPEAQALGRQLMVDQTYSLVRRATTRKSDEALLQRPTATPMIEVQVSHDGCSKSQRARQPYRGRQREDNAFRDHNYFFEINELYQEVVLVGRACAGKSSLLNGLLQQQLAKTSSTPNTTRAINFYQSVSPEALAEYHKHHHAEQLVKLPGGGLQLTFVDVPGYGITGMSDQWRDAAIELTDAYFGVRRSVNTVLFCLDCEKGLTKIDLKYFQWLENVQGVFYIVLTKCDSVPHSRVCAVMRQVYELITKNRRKYRKVFPFVIPTSAKDGTNMDVLRGLITETSGMIPGDKLRDLLKRKQEEVLQKALEQEAARLAAVRQSEQLEARSQYLAAHPEAAATLLPSPSSPSPAAAAAASTGALPPSQTPPDTQRYRLSLRSPDDAGENLRSTGGAATAAAGQRGSRTREFLRWRAAHPLARERTPYSDTPFRLNTGVERPEDEYLSLEYTHPAAAAAPGPASTPAELQQQRQQPPPHEVNPSGAVPAMSGPKEGAAASRVKGVLPADATPSAATATATAAAARRGAVSQFLDTLSQFESQSNRTRRHPRRAGRGAERPALLAVNAEGRLAAHRAGRAVGPALVTPTTAAESRQAAWRAAQLKQMLQTEDQEAPWRALHRLTRRLDEEKVETVLRRRMSRKDRESYLRQSGRVAASFEKFEGEVHSAKYMNEVRVTKTQRSQAQMHLNATAKINYRSMPTGLWKQYGKQDTYWPTPRVLGRANDESHQPLP